MKVETYRVTGWEDVERGLIVAENDEWLLVKHIPIDYIVDGYKLYRKAFIASRESGNGEEKVARVLKLKGVEATAPKGFKLRSVKKMLTWSEKTYGIFEFQQKVEDELYYGKNATIEKKKLVMDIISPDGLIDDAYEYEFSLKKIRVVSFDSDYFHAIRLLMEDEMKNN